MPQLYRRLLPVCILLTWLLPMAGCLAPQVARDGDGLRQVLVEMYTEQAIDNLIRAYNNEIFAQFTYGSLSVSDVDKSRLSAIGLEGDFTHGRARDVTKTAAQQLTSSVTNAWKIPFGLNNQRDRSLSFEANPVTTQNSIYEAYLTFAHDPNLFCVSCEKPSCDVHIMRQRGKCWYWVPKEAGPAFLQLVVSTSFVNEQPQALYWSATIAETPAKRSNESKDYVIKLGKEVPNDSGWLILTLTNGRRVALKAFAMAELPTKPRKAGPPLGAPTKMLYAQIPIGADVTNIADLKGAKVQFVSDNYPNTAPPPGPDLQKVQDTLDNIRLLVNKSGSL